MINKVMFNVMMHSNPTNVFYKVRNNRTMAFSKDMRANILGTQRPVTKAVAINIPNIKENIAVVFQTLKDKCIVMIDPAEQDASTIGEQLWGIIENLRQKTRHIHDDVAMIAAGGLEYDVKNPKFSNKSRDVVNEIKDFIEVEKIPATVMMEKKQGINDNGFDLYSHRDSVVLSGGIIDDISLAEPETVDELKDICEEYFEIFNISPKAPIMIVDEILPSSSTNKRFLR